MPGSTFGQLFRITTFGESHGGGVGVVVDGCPPGLEISEKDIQKDLDRRKPGQSAITTPRKETDRITIYSGIFEGKTTGTPIMMMAANQDARSEDYKELKKIYRPSHADFTYEAKYGRRNWEGSGRASARETLSRVAAGAIAKKYLKEKLGIEILSFVEQVGEINTPALKIEKLTMKEVESNIIRCPDKKTAEKMIKLIEQARREGDSIGGVIKGIIKNVPAGLGEPVFDKLHADLGKAMLSINAVKGFEIGSGFAGTLMRGSRHNDSFIKKNGRTITKTNYSGGIQGGISNGMPIIFHVAFKPVSTINKKQKTINKDGEQITLKASGRHDPCVLPRAVPIVDAMAALVIMDHHLRDKAQNN